MYSYRGFIALEMNLFVLYYYCYFIPERVPVSGCPARDARPAFIPCHRDQNWRQESSRNSLADLTIKHCVISRNSLADLTIKHCVISRNSLADLTRKHCVISRNFLYDLTRKHCVISPNSLADLTIKHCVISKHTKG